MGDESVSTKPVFFAVSHRRWRIFASLLGLASLFVASLAVLAVISLLRSGPAARTGLATTSRAPTTAAAPKAAGKALALVIAGGPDARSTPQILDILAREKVSATFFPLGHQAVQEADLLRRIFAEGHEIGESSAPGTSDAIRQQLEGRSARRVLEAVTGHSTLLQLSTLPPFDAQASLESNWLGASALAAGIRAEPARMGVPTPFALPSPAPQGREGYVLMLRDEAGQDLAAALPKIIQDSRHSGYAFTTMAGLLGKQREELMPRLDSKVDRFLARGNSLLLHLTSHSGRYLEWIFTVTAFLAMLRTMFVVGLALCDAAARRRRKRAPGQAGTPYLGKVSVLVPAYNEVLNICAVIDTALASDYPDVEVIVIDDGSTDNTFAAVQAAFATNARVQLLRKPNGGKASALNAGLRVARGEVIVCIDGDTAMLPDTISKLLAEFRSDDVAAVAGCIKIANAHNLLTRWQEVEYMIGQNLDRQALDSINGVNTVPGALGAFRRQAILAAGGYTGDTLAEDTDLTLRLLGQGYRVTFAPRAYALTEAPEQMAMLFKQRFRWSYGALQTLWKHRSLFGARINPGLGLFTLPQVLLFQLILPFLIPVADLCLLGSLWSGTAWHVLAFGVMFLLVDVAAAVIALLMAGERRRIPYLTFMLISQRVGYRYFIFFPLLKAYLAAMHGRAVGWGHLQRLGRVAQSV